MRGRSRVAVLAKAVHTIVGLPCVSWRPIDVNGDSGALFLDGQEKLIGVMAIDIAGSQITNIQGIVNPDKQAHLGPVADLNSLLEFARR